MTLSTQEYLRTAARQCRAADCSVSMSPSTAEGIADILDGHDARVTSLLDANNREVEARRSVQRRLDAAHVTVDALSNEILDLRDQVRRAREAPR